MIVNNVIFRLVLIFYFLSCTSSRIIGQNYEGATSIVQPIVVRCGLNSGETHFLLRVKGQEYFINSEEIQSINFIESRWIKGVKVFRRSDALQEWGVDKDDTLVILELKRRSLRYLSQHVFSIKDEED